jgi:multidrug efflux pump subunit AcrA (membrane-fusion protein)
LVANGRAGFRPVVLGLRDGRRVAILDGLREGDTVILNPAGIEQNKKVRPEIKSDMKKNL